MQVVACDAPLGPFEPAPLTSLLLSEAEGAATLSAFWSSDDRYYVRSDEGGNERTEAGSAAATPRWFRIEDEASAVIASDGDELSSQASIARQFLDVIPMGGGRIAFPVGSTGRTVYRVWRSKADSSAQARSTGRIRILGVRAGRSLRRPA